MREALFGTSAIGTKRTHSHASVTSAFDPQRTFWPLLSPRRAKIAVLERLCWAERIAICEIRAFVD